VILDTVRFDGGCEKTFAENVNKNIAVTSKIFFILFLKFIDFY
jgi:hypothetical protein